MDLSFFPNNKVEKTDIAINKGKITELGSVLSMIRLQVIDLKGLIVIPGAIDTQVHFRRAWTDTQRRYLSWD